MCKFICVMFLWMTWINKFYKKYTHTKRQIECNTLFNAQQFETWPNMKLKIPSMSGYQFAFDLLHFLNHAIMIPSCENGPIPAAFFFIFVFSSGNSKYIKCKILAMTEYETRISGIGSDRSANWATTTALELARFYQSIASSLNEALVLQVAAFYH